MTVSSRVLTVCDACVAAISTFWSPTGDDSVERLYEVDLDASTLTGRKVYVFPAGTAWVELGTRAGDVHDERVQVLVVERYTDAGPATKQWVDERVEFVQDAVLDLLDDPREQPVTGYWCQESAVDPVYDIEELTQRKLFLSLASFTFRANDG